MRLSSGILAAFLFTSTLGAQTSQRPLFRAGVEIIEVDVSIVDDRGRPITDLLAPEFTVTVDGRARRVVTAEFVSLRPPDRPRQADATASDLTSKPYSSNTASARGRLVVMVVDQDSIMFGEGRQVMRAAGGFLDKLGPSDKVAFLSIPPTGGAVDFTSNHQLVRTALQRTAGLANRPRLQFNIGISEAYAIDTHSDARTEIAVVNRLCGQIRNPVEFERCEMDVRMQAAVIAGEIRQRVDTSLRALRSLLESLREVEGRKSLVWISQGLMTDGTGADLAEIGRLAAAANTTVNVLMLDAPLADVSEREQSPTVREDRDLEKRGLELLAGMSRGALFPISVNADFAFQRIENELSGYYLLAVESNPADRDGKRHSIKVAVRRQGATVRARREFQASPETTKPETLEERLGRTLRSPFAIAELPLRLATYAYQDPTSSKVRVLVTTEIERGRKQSDRDGAKAPAEVAIALVLFDSDGRAVVNNVQRAKLTPVDSVRGPLLQYNGTLLVDPGTYTLKLGAIDDEGRRGSIEHTITAWQMTGVPFAVSDLLLADSPTTPGNALRPAVEARLTSGRLSAYLELYSDRADFFGTSRVTIEVAASESGPVLASADGRLSAPSEASDSRSRAVDVVLPLDAFPPGAYIARAIVTDGNRTIGRLIRPFEIVATRLMSIASMLPAVGAFQRDTVLQPDVLGFFLDVLDKGRPALKVTISQVRSGRFDGAARQAFDAGDQLAAAFLRGLELFSKGDLNQAGTQFAAALRIDADFAPAAFYLGACYAAGGRDREAIALWRRALAGPNKTVLAYVVLGDALLRSGDVQVAIAPLSEALAAWPDSDELRRRLAIAQAVGSQSKEALETIEPYLARHPADHEALLVALHAIYASHAAGQMLVSPDGDRERMAQYARAYAAARGPRDALIATWAAYVALH